FEVNIQPEPQTPLLFPLHPKWLPPTSVIFSDGLLLDYYSARLICFVAFVNKCEEEVKPALVNIAAPLVSLKAGVCIW
ncbi:hypothetical protein KUCAC02_015272, partial [Chaenocephalus aceratus]